MLRELKIENLAIIDELDIEFDKGFIVLTGETGAGKSIILSGINLLIGEKASVDMIRDGEENLVAQGVFDVDKEQKKILEAMGIDTDGDEIIIRRSYSRSGKARAFINNVRITLTDLKEIASTLVDIVGQHSHQMLLNKNNHIKLLDSFLNKDEKYIKENFEEVHNILIAQEGNDMISVEPSKYIMKMSSIIKKDKDLQNEIKGIIEKAATDINIENLTGNEEFNILLEEYMEKFGDRTVHELKLEALTLREDPLFLIRMIYSISMTKEVTEHSKRNISEEQNKIYENLKISPLKKFILKKTVSYAKKFIRLRENLRYERTKVFGMVRKIMKKMGTYLKEENIITHERDVFYLTIDEIFGLIDGALIDTDLKKLIDLRKEKYKEYEEEAVLPDRFLTRGFLGENFHYEDLTGNEQEDKNILRGTGCSKGVVKGKVKIVLNPMNTEVEDGDIVVTKSTDPSWVMVFPLLKGLIVEKGSLLSHSAIISREMNIPAIVGVQGAVTALKTGDFVQFDGSTGIIKKLEEI